MRHGGRWPLSVLAETSKEAELCGPERGPSRLWVSPQNMFVTYSPSYYHSGKLSILWNVCVCMCFSLQPQSRFAFRNTVTDNFENFSLLLFFNKICQAFENILSQKTDVATTQSLFFTTV